MIILTSLSLKYIVEPEPESIMCFEFAKQNITN